MLAVRLILLCAGATASARDGFPDPDEPLAPGEARRAAALRDAGDPAAALCAPSVSARDTAMAMGLCADVNLRLADVDHGAWRGLSFAAAAAGHGPALAAWLSAPEAGTPGGEPLSAVAKRIAPLLAEIAERQGRVLAITHPMVVRAFLIVALSLPVAVAMRVDLAPLGGVTLSHHRGWRWRALTPRRETAC